MKIGEKHKTVQNTSPTAKLMDPMIDPSQEQACNNIIKISKTSICSSTSQDYVLISESFNITAYDQTITNQQPFIFYKSIYRRMRRWDLTKYLKNNQYRLKTSWPFEGLDGEVYRWMAVLMFYN